MFFVALFITISPCCMAQTIAGTTIPPADPSIRDQIKADRARQNAEAKDASQARPWDRDANGKRPWEPKDPPTK
ncbi:hypothetical protein [Bradyrhizobium commune]|uniref:Uncharacterized protein n=1 Tax=Bradyrhizobium commune TaxID=83627 RepID=A0A7S9H2N9_9BRAD|nr:hypothetical protein [Bradyrhizobium commune]QPF94964.1 hypothetical protein IC761_17555 [Bradyrhizobium commune]